MKERAKSPKFWLCIALILCLISMIGASLMQTSNNTIIIKQMTWESPSGHQLSADLYRPKTATADKPAPAIVTIEGWYNNKEMQDLYTTELARRGYVVLTLDMHGHGDSECLASAELYDGAVGVDGAVQLVASLPYVDASRIGVTGHSSGGTAANMAVAIDNERDAPLIKSVLQQAGDWQDDTGADHSGDYGSRSVGIIASKHDDFYFGTYDTGKRLYYGSEEEAKKSCFLTRLLFAQIITAVFGTLVYPFVKTQHRLMVVVKYPVVTPKKYTGIFDCAQKIIINEGSYSLFQGNSGNFYRWLYWSLALVLYDEFQKYF